MVGFDTTNRSFAVGHSFMSMRGDEGNELDKHEYDMKQMSDHYNHTRHPGFVVQFLFRGLGRGFSEAW